MVQLKIDGKVVNGREGETLLDVSRRNGIEIPTLCHHEAVEDWGGCRLCVVEITKKAWDGWSRLVTACLYPVEADLEVDTKSETVTESRRVTLDLLLARCPETPKVRELASEYGIDETTYTPREEPDNCILCGLCVRICAALGHSAISLANRGPEKKVDTPFGKPSVSCVGCGSCAKSCPTFAIPMRDLKGERRIWERTFKLVECEACGAAHLTSEQVSHLCETRGFSKEAFTKCDACRRKEAASTLSTIVKW
ncbi:MAG: 2Fe-2S iron-sulfur cluster-binding protein [Planctomycetota bacterium]|jgi:NADH dehydrogenase/NADH:ubiquinone oxidoreductase subunit G